MDPLSIAAVGWLMSSLVNKAVTVLLEAWAKRIGIGSEFKTLKDQLLQLGALLTSARGLRTDNILLKELVQNLQQLAYQAENLLDELDYYRLEDGIRQRGTQEKVNCSNKSSVASSSFGFRLASRSIISTLKEMSCHSAPNALLPLPKTLSSKINLSRRMNELAEQLKKSEEKVRNAVQTESVVITACKTEIKQTKTTNSWQMSSFLTEPRVFGRGQTSSFLTKSRIFGRDQERDKLINLLTNEESTIVGNVHVLAIVGSGGVGKTTLAQLVFNDPKVHIHFEVRLWICVSTWFDIDRLTREMLEGAFGRSCDLSNLNEIQNKLKNELESKRFLLVLDDMWEDKDKSQWDSIVAPLNYCKIKGSKILVTTRNQSVAKMIDARDISLHGLERDAYLSFFSTCIFNDPNYGGNWRLRNIGQQIANKLKGNPLAAKTVSALLKGKLDERYWMKIRDSEEWKSQSGPNDIMPALRLSYEHMSFHLQRCFSYCAIIPEDHPFTCEELVYLWMAQGFLDVRSEGKNMEDIGSAYFNDLLDRGFFQTIQSRYFGKRYYTFHDLTHDLANMISFKECLRIDGTELKQIPPTIRHLSIFNSRKRGEEAVVGALACLEGENLSTIINWNELPSGVISSISNLFYKTKFLRAVTLSLCFQMPLHNFNFQNYVSLRYLRLIISNIVNCNTLPSEICMLYHLEVFQIEDGELLDELPNNFSDLVSLRHFIVQGMEELHSKIRGVGKLTSLQELNHFGVQQKIGFEIEQLGSLKEIGGSLKIWNLQNVKSEREAKEARLAEKENLDNLYLQWNHGEKDNESVLEGLKPNNNLKSLGIVGYGGVASPTWWEPSLKLLESLTLEGCKAWELLPPIGELEFLKHLKLSGVPLREIGPQCYGTCQNMKFSSLEKLEIIDMPDLEKWVWSDQLQLFSSFKKLKGLQIRGCPKLVDFPLSRCTTSKVLERFPFLERLIIEDCPLIFQLPPLPYSSILSSISIARSGFIKLLLYVKSSLILEDCSSLKASELLALHELRSVSFLEISSNSSLESLDLHPFVALENLVITGCESLASLIFGEHLVCLKTLKIISCKTLSSIKGLKSWVNLRELHFRECHGFIAAWESALKEIERSDPDFSLSLTTIQGDSLALLTLPICKQLASLKKFYLEVLSFTKRHEISSQLLTSIDLFDIRGCNNLQSFPFDLFPFLHELWIRFPRIPFLSKNRCNEITEECLKLRNIKRVYINEFPVQIFLKLRSAEMVRQQWMQSCS